MQKSDLNRFINVTRFKMVINRLIACVLFILSLAPGAPAFAESSAASDRTSATDSSYSLKINALNVKSFKEKSRAITQLEAVYDLRTLEVFKALLDGRLFYRKSDKLIVFAQDLEEGYIITDVVANKIIGEVGKREIKKIRVNNKLRKQLRGAIARLSLSSDNADIRISAIKEITKDLSPEITLVLKQALARETNEEVKQALHTVLAFSDLDSNDQAIRLNAITLLAESMSQQAKSKLATLVQQTEDGSYIETDAKVRHAASKALSQIESRLETYALIEKIFFGLSLGSVLLLAAIGLAITFGVMGVINMAHGELIMIGAYTTYVIQLLMPENIGLSLLVAVPAAFIVSGLFGIAIERSVIRFLYGRPLETLLATFGISLVLQQLVRSIFSPLNRSVETPAWMSGSFEINNALSLTYNRFYIIIFSLIVFFALHLILKKTTLGLKVRAVSQNRAMAKAMGTRTEWVDALTFGLGSGIAGVAGVALSQLTNVGPNLGQSYIIDSFMVVVFGGVGNIWGTLVGAMSLGVMNKFLEPWAGAVLAKIMVLVFIILFIQKKPRGLFPQKGRAAEN